MKKVISTVCILLVIALGIVVLFFLNAFFGNPVSGSLARMNAKRYLEENYAHHDYQITKVGYNFKTENYYAKIQSPSSQDSYFTLYFNGLGRYCYDTYEGITSGSNTYSRLDTHYRELIKSKIPYENGRFDVSIAYGELRLSDFYEVFTYTDETGKTIEYRIDKDYGMQRSHLILDGEYDIRELGSNHGRIVLYIHDPEVTVERAAELLLEVKAYLDENQIPFHAIDFNLCTPRNENGQMVGDQITLFDFLYTDIYEEGLIQRVQEHWDIAREHFAIQDAESAKFMESQSKNP